MSDHTKGPWTVDGTKALGAYGVWTDYAVNPGHDGSGYPEQICSFATGPLRWLGDKPTREANGRLISAAPELLEAHEPDADVPGPEFLDWLADRIVNVYGEHKDVDFVLALRRKAAKAREAIAKATGDMP